MISMGQLGRRAAPFLVFAAVSTGLVTGAYLFLERFFQDRQSALFSPHPRESENVQRRENRNGSQSTTTTGKNGKRPNELPGQTAAEAGQAAIQQQLKTLQDINNINEMNRRLMEQQRRMQNQH
jgi:hypothetical protein